MATASPARSRARAAGGRSTWASRSPRCSSAPTRARCPECGRAQAVRFDIQSFLLGSLLADRAPLFGDVHRLARAYGWSRESILALARHERRAYAAFVDAEKPPRRRSVA